MYYRVRLTTKVNHKKLKKGSGIIAIETDDYKKSEILAIKKKGYTVLGYLSVGTIEKERPWYKEYKKFALKRLKDWPNECYADCREEEWQDFLYKRAKDLKKKGVDGLWCDNLDVYEYYKSDDMLISLIAILQHLRTEFPYIMVNGGKKFFEKAPHIDTLVDGITQEEVFSQILNYSGKGKFGKQSKDESKKYKAYMKGLKKAGVDTFLLEYTTDSELKKKIKDFVKTYELTGWCISGKVNL